MTSVVQLIVIQFSDQPGHVWLLSFSDSSPHCVFCVLCFVFLRLLNVLEVIAPFKHFNKLREFVQMKLPPGFPVKLGEHARITQRSTLQNVFSKQMIYNIIFLIFHADIPVFPTITATVTFQEFRYDKFDESIFTIPNDYKEDPSRFPDL